MEEKQEMRKNRGKMRKIAGKKTERQAAEIEVQKKYPIRHL